MMTELRKQFEQLEKDVNHRITKNHESLMEELKNNNETLKKEIGDDFALIVEGMKVQMDGKLVAIMRMLDDKNPYPTLLGIEWDLNNNVVM